MLHVQAAELNVKQLDEDGLLTLIATLPAKKSKYTIAAEQEAQKEAAAATSKQKAEKVGCKKIFRHFPNCRIIRVHFKFIAVHNIVIHMKETHDNW